MRATIIVDSNDEKQREAISAWLLKWQDKFAYMSDYDGCGCCVELFNVEGPAEAIAEVPMGMLTESDWTQGQGLTPTKSQ